MLRNLLLACTATLLFVQSNAQSETDSLWNIWSSESINDSIRMDALKDLCGKHLAFSMPDSAEVLNKVLRDFATANNSKLYEAYTYNIEGLILKTKGEYGPTIPLNNKAMEMAGELKDTTLLTACLNDLGNAFMTQGDYLKAYKHYKKAIALADQAGLVERSIVTTGNLGNVFIDLNEWEKAETIYLTQLENIDGEENKQSVAGTTTNLGMIYSELKDYPKAIEYYSKGIELSNQGGFKQFEAIGLFNLSNIYFLTNDIDNATLVNDRLRELAAEMNYSFFTTITEVNECRINAVKLPGIETAEQCEACIEFVEKIGLDEVEHEVLKVIYNLYKDSGKSDKALHYHELLADHKKKMEEGFAQSEILKEELREQVRADSLAQAEQERLVQEAHDQEVKKKNRTKNMALWSGLVILIVAIGLFVRYRVVKRSRDESEDLLLNILPADIAAELKEKGEASARNFDMVTVLFTDFKGFTAASEKMTSEELVSEINACFKSFDEIIEKFGVEKIKTIGDAYMAAGGLPVPQEESVKKTVQAALEMQAFIIKRKKERDASNLPAFEMRVGIHTGPVVAGIVGVKKFQYDVWGDTVNTASRMESSGEVNRVNISESTYNYLKEDSNFTFESRGKIEAKGKGELAMYFVENKVEI